MTCANCGRENDRGEVCDSCAFFFQQENYEEAVRDAAQAMRNYRAIRSFEEDIKELVEGR